MGRNGKRPPVFPAMIKFINENVGKVVESKDILLGYAPGRTKEVSYLYSFMKLGYVERVDASKSVYDPTTKYRILKKFPPYYSSVVFKNELREFNGLMPEHPKKHYITMRRGLVDIS